MSTYDLESTTDVQRRPAVRHESSGPDASTMIGLQRLAGNSAVAAAIQSGQIGSDGGPINLQRIGEDEDDEFEDEDDSEDFTDEDIDAGTESDEVSEDESEDESEEEEEDEEEVSAG